MRANPKVCHGQSSYAELAAARGLAGFELRGDKVVYHCAVERPALVAAGEPVSVAQLLAELAAKPATE